MSYEDRHQLFLTENFALPVFMGRSTDAHIKRKIRFTQKEECREIAKQQMGQYEKELEKIGVQISENNVKIEITDTACIAKGEFLVIEQAAKEAPCEMTAPGKDRTSDEQ